MLLVNILLYELLKQLQHNNYKIRGIKRSLIINGLLAIVLPLAASFIIALHTETPMNKPAGVIIIQPNVDPYGKFDAGSVSTQVQQLITLSESQLDSNTRLVIWPETALSAEDVFQDRLLSYPAYQPVFNFVKKHPNITLLSGIEIWKNYGREKTTNSAMLGGDNNYYDNFNAAVALKSGVAPEFYYKSKLVPGVETLPDFLRWMAPVFEKFGGTTGGYGSQKQSSVLKQTNQPYIVAPIICYESIYGEYISTYVQKGANLLTIITNDGWWGNTPGHKQHLHYARLRAIETRRWVARSANTGISAVIDEYGNIMATQPWDKAAVIKYNIPALQGETVYVKYGDILSKIAVTLACVLVLWNLVLMVRKKFVK